MNVLVLGSSGMLGNAVYKYFMDKLVLVTCFNNRWPSKLFKSNIRNYNGDYVVNCIGAIAQRTDKFEINYHSPEPIYIIHDC